MLKHNVLSNQEVSAKVNELVTSLVNSVCLSCLERETRLLTIGLLAQPEHIGTATKLLEANCLKDPELVPILIDLAESSERSVLRLVLESTHKLRDNYYVRDLARRTIVEDRYVDEATVCAADVLRRDEDCLSVVANIFAIATSCGCRGLDSFAHRLWDEGLSQSP